MEHAVPASRVKGLFGDNKPTSPSSSSTDTDSIDAESVPPKLPEPNSEWVSLSNLFFKTLHVLLIPVFFVGLFLIIRSPLWTRKAKVIWVASIVVLFLIGSFNSLAQFKALRVARAEATALWDSNEQGAAVEIYSKILKRHWNFLEKADRSKFVRRVVDFDVENSNDSDRSKELIRRALEDQVAVTFENPRSTALQQIVMAEQKQQRVEKQHVQDELAASQTETALAERKEAKKWDSAISTVELINAFENEAAAAKKFGSQTLGVIGTVIKVEYGLPPNASFKKRYFIVLGGVPSPAGYHNWVNCYVDSSKVAEKITPGSVILVRGKMLHGYVGVNMIDCEVFER